MHSFIVGLFLVAFVAMSFGAPDLARVGRLKMFLREFRETKRNGDDCVPDSIVKGEKCGAVAVDKDACVAAHNKLREKHDAQPLTWSAELAEHAQKWANHLANKVGHMQHAQGTGEGENLYWSKSSATGTCEDAVKAWASEEKDYPANHPPHTFQDFLSKHPFGHYTQEVWKSTKFLGVAIATKESDGMTETFIVARYSPPGNMLGAFEKNVE